jgi:hypothetical protein
MSKFTPKPSNHTVPPLAYTNLPPMVSVPFTAGNAPVRSVPNLTPNAPAPAMQPQPGLTNRPGYPVK